MHNIEKVAFDESSRPKLHPINYHPINTYDNSVRRAPIFVALTATDTSLSISLETMYGYYTIRKVLN